MMSQMLFPGPRIARRDILITALFVVLGIPFITWGQDGGHAANPVAGFLILLAVLPLLWRRRAPLLAVAGTLVGTAIHVAIYGTITRCGLLIPLLFVEAFAVGAWLPRGQALLGLGLVMGAGVVMLSHDASAGWGGLEVLVPIGLVLWVIGRITRSRSDLVARLRERNSELDQTREANARLEVATDRMRLSCELDELLRTRLGDLATLAEADGGEPTDRLARIEAESRATLNQMRAVVGELRGEAGVAAAPQPTLTHLDALLLSAKGPEAKLEVTGDPRVLPAGLELSAYRVIEHLLAATEDAPDVEVRVDFGTDALKVTVAGPSRKRGQVAIERARQRVALQHGELHAETHEGRTRATAAFPVLVPV